MSLKDIEVARYMGVSLEAKVLYGLLLSHDYAGLRQGQGDKAVLRIGGHWPCGTEKAGPGTPRTDLR